ncbi:protein kinase [Nonomuraea sp. NPDC000554]|uniref:serine/threonine-protein kinase n=1 Tax=Nonomuraea sp. NPDC000554 TaxID=3154259 RepID=UPI0033312FFB
MPEQQKRLLADRYELIAPLGRGTMGTVWRARDRALGREVAVKEIRQDPGLTEEQRVELRERMVREGRLAARISHPAVAAIHDVIIQDNSPWIIMELIEARSLEQVIDEEGPLPPRLVAEIGVDLLGALRAAHAAGITHRDVKPGNVLITENGRVVLTDFGIAKAEGDSRLTKTGMVIGSPGYTAPERARGEYTGPESDIWSLGATLYFAVEGRPAYERATIAETLAALLSENADPPTQAGQLRPVLTGLLNKDYRQRLGAAQAETMLRMVADTPTSEMPVINIEASNKQEPPVPNAKDAAPGVPSSPASKGGPTAAAGPTRGSRPPTPGNRPPAAGPQGAAPAAQGGSGVPRAGAFGSAPSSGAPAGAFGPAQGGVSPAGAFAPGSAPQPYDPEQTITVARPKTPIPKGMGQRGAPPQSAPPKASPPQPAPPQASPPQPPPQQWTGDEAAVTTRRVQLPQNGSPGQQVYPLPAPPMSPPMPQPMMPDLPVPKGLGTDLFAIAGQPEQRDGGNRNGMLVLMGVAAGAAVVIAILIVAVISS